MLKNSSFEKKILILFIFLGFIAFLSLMYISYNEYLMNVPLRRNSETTYSEVEEKDVLNKELGVYEIKLKEYAGILDEKYIAIFDNVILKPEEIFSFNESVANIGEEPDETYDDYLLSKLASALYNAVILSDLKIIERTNNPQEPQYIAMGQDVKIRYDTVDFKFKNTSQSSVKIMSEADGEKIKFSIYGSSSIEDSKIKIHSEIQKYVNYDTEYKMHYEIEEVEDLGIADGILKEGEYGKVVDSYKIFKENGTAVKKEFLATSTYLPVNQIKIMIDGESNKELDEGQNAIVTNGALQLKENENLNSVLEYRYK